MDVQPALSAQGQHVAGLKKIKLRPEGRGMEHLAPRRGQRALAGRTEALRKIEKKIAVRPGLHAEAHPSRRHVGLLQGLQRHRLGARKSFVVDDGGRRPYRGGHGTVIQRPGKTKRLHGTQHRIRPDKQTRFQRKPVFARKPLIP